MFPNLKVYPTSDFRGIFLRVHSIPEKLKFQDFSRTLVCFKSFPGLQISTSTILPSLYESCSHWHTFKIPVMYVPRSFLHKHGNFTLTALVIIMNSCARYDAMLRLQNAKKCIKPACLKCKELHTRLSNE